MLINVDELIFNATRERRLVDLKVYRSFKTEILNYRTAKNAGEYNKSAEISIIKKIISILPAFLRKFLSSKPKYSAKTITVSTISKSSCKEDVSINMETKSSNPLLSICAITYIAKSTTVLIKNTVTHFTTSALVHFSFFTFVCFFIKIPLSHVDNVSAN